MVLYSKFTYGSQFSEEKNGQEIRFLVPEILSKYKRSIFLGRPVAQLLTALEQFEDKRNKLGLSSAKLSYA